MPPLFLHRCSLYAAIFSAALLFTNTAGAGTVESDGDDLVIKTKGGLEIKTKGEEYSFKVGGSLQLNYTQHDGVFNGEKDVDYTGSELDFRHMRINISGNVARNWKYYFEYDFQGSGKTVDVYFQYGGWGEMASLKLGKFRPAFGMDALNGTKDVLAIERNLINQAFTPGRLNGISLNGHNDTYQYAAGLFEGGEGNNKEIDWSFASRLSFTPVRMDDMVVHIGAAFMQQDLGEGTVTKATTSPTNSFEGANLSFIPEVKGNASKFLSTDFVHNGMTGYSLEFAGTYGPLFYQLEYHDISFDGKKVEDAGNIDSGIDMDGYSAQIAWTLTGETRPYKGEKGVFANPKPSGPRGAWEVFVRYSDLDMSETQNQRATGYDDTQIFTLGLNWYVTSQIRASLNYIAGETDRRDGGANDDGTAVAGLLQFKF